MPQQSVKLQQKPFYVYCGWLIDGKGDDIKERVLLRVEDSRFTLLDLHSKPSDLFSASIPLVDFSDGTVIPPLVDSHVHLTLSGSLDPAVRENQKSLGYAQAQSVIRKHLAMSLGAGILAVRDGGDAQGHTLRFKVHRQDGLEIPLLLRVSGRAWHACGRYGSWIGRSPRQGESLASCVKRQEEACDQVKVINSGMNSLKVFGRQTPPQFTREELSQAFHAAGQRGFRVMVHANGERAVRDSILAGCDSIEHGFFMGRENLELLAERQVFWVPTLMTMKAYAYELLRGTPQGDVAARNFDHQLGQVSRSLDVGAPVALGTDSGSPGVHHGETFAEEFQSLLEAGFSLPKAVEAASRNGARLLGLEKELGMIDLSMPASFLFYRCRPEKLAARLSRPEVVFLAGTPLRVGGRAFEGFSSGPAGEKCAGS